MLYLNWRGKGKGKGKAIVDAFKLKNLYVDLNGSENKSIIIDFNK
mgnify:CR=1 FL=1